MTTPADPEPLEAIKADPDYAHRAGYSPQFLGRTVPLPALTDAIRPKAFARDEGHGAVYELKYHHFSVILNRDARLAFVTAVNYDGSAQVRQTRQGADRWFFDPRVDERFQAGEEFYSDNPLDRGHLVRRADAAWGASETEAKRANDDTFHFTNCSPQHEVFNQAAKATKQHLLLWGNIEDHIARQGTDGRQRLSIFSGPVFRSTDRLHRGLALPREFWKIIVYLKNGGAAMGAVAFILSQEGLIKNVPFEEFVVGPYQPFQVKIREIEARTGLEFGSLRAADPLESGPFESSYPNVDAVPLSSLDDIAM
jgi:endonuclease G